MKNKKNHIITLICISTFFFTGLKTSVAQDNDSRVEATKYEIAVDLQHFFSDGYPDKVLFKINNIQENQVKGAYRLGIGALYWIDKYKITHDDENYELTAKRHQNIYSLSLGYEFQKRFDKVVFYYGADLGALIGILDDIDYPHVDETYNLFFVPFAGVKVFLSKNLSVAFETGIKNFYSWSKSEGSGGGNPDTRDNRQFHSYYTSKLELPYSLTFNFNF
jgi:hypothetical protein